MGPLQIWVAQPSGDFASGMFRDESGRSASPDGVKDTGKLGHWGGEIVYH